MNRTKKLAKDYAEERDRQRAWAESDKKGAANDGYVKAFVFPTDSPARVTMVKSDEKWLKDYVLHLCERRYKDVAEVRKSLPKESGMELFYAVPSKKSGLGKGYRWHSSVGFGMNEFLLGPAVLVAANTNTGKIRDFTAREEHRAISFDRQDYKCEKMLDVTTGEVLSLIKGKLEGVESADRLIVESQNWQLLYLRVEHGGLSFIKAVPKSSIIDDGEVELIHYADGEPIR